MTKVRFFLYIFGFFRLYIVNNDVSRMKISCKGKCMCSLALRFFLFQRMEHMFHLMECTFRQAELTFQRMERKIYRNEKTFQPACLLCCFVPQNLADSGN